jgi:UDP-N-acetylmuramate--alanine ligase
VNRRFTVTGRVKGITVVDDYGHHPVEIAAVIDAARSAASGRVIAVVQPHRYTRLRDLFKEFCACFTAADIVIVADVYPAGEDPIPGIDRTALVQGLIAHGHRQVLPLDDPRKLAEMVTGLARSGDVVVCLGAGSITTWAHALPAEIEARLGNAEAGGRR